MHDQDLEQPLAAREQAANRRQPAAERGKTAVGQKPVLYFMLVILLWVGLVGGGYFAVQRQLQRSEQFFAGQLNELRSDNKRLTTEIVGAMQLFEQELSGSRVEMQQLRQEMEMIQEELELTGESLTGTDATRQSLTERITELDWQLTGLQEQLKKLEAAVRAL